MQILRAIALLFICAACSSVRAQDEQGNTLVYGLTLSVSGIDPHINQNAELGIVLRNVYDTLVYRDPENRAIVPGLASSWVVSDDGLAYTFTLRQDVLFHDGTPFNAQAVAANLDRITDPNLKSQRAALLLGPYAGYEVLDPYTITLRLREPYSPFLDALAQVYVAMASPAALSEYADEPERYQFHQVGTGPFIFVEYVPEDRIVIRRNPNYGWRPPFYGDLPSDAVNTVIFRFYRDPATRLAALEQGEAQVMGEISPLDARALAGGQTIAFAPVPIPGQPLQFYFNTQQAPTDRLEVRQALLYASNRGAIVDAVYQGFSPLAWGPLAAQTLYYNPSVVGAYGYNPEAARQLLNGVGYADSDNDGVLDLAGEPLSIKLIQPPWGLVPEVVQFLQTQWREIGVEVIVEPVPGFTTLIEKVNSGDYHLVSFDAPGLDPAILNARYLSDGAVNWTGYANPELDLLLKQAASVSDEAERWTLYGTIQGLIMQEALVLPIRDYVNLNGYVSGVTGLRFDPYGWFPLLYDVGYTAP